MRAAYEFKKSRVAPDSPLLVTGFAATPLEAAATVTVATTVCAQAETAEMSSRPAANKKVGSVVVELVAPSMTVTVLPPPT
mgnify:CR=1 FL=1